jgi:hypothetical protein
MYSKDLAPIDLGPVRLADVRLLRRMGIGPSDGEATFTVSGLRKRLTLLEITFVARAFAATPARPRETQNPPSPRVQIQGDWLSHREIG